MVSRCPKSVLATAATACPDSPRNSPLLAIIISACARLRASKIGCSRSNAMLFDALRHAAPRCCSPLSAYTSASCPGGYFDGWHQPPRRLCKYGLPRGRAAVGIPCGQCLFVRDLDQGRRHPLRQTAQLFFCLLFPEPSPLWSSRSTSLPASACGPVTLHTLSRRFEEPIDLPDGRKLRTLKEARGHRVAGQRDSKSEHTMPKDQAAARTVTEAAENNGPVIFARMGMMQEGHREHGFSVVIIDAAELRGHRHYEPGFQRGKRSGLNAKTGVQ